MNPLAYPMNLPSRGPVLIFNNQTYPSNQGLQKRLFNDIDTAALMVTFRTLGYTQVSQKRNLTAQEMLNEIAKVARSDHSSNDSVVVVFLAYGEHNLVFAKDRPIGLQVLLDPLKGDVCHPSLVGKPKIIILQTCNPEFQTIENDAESDSESDEDESKKHTHVIPSEADFAYLGSEVPGLITGRKFSQGSLFISKLCQRLKQDGKRLELRKIMTRTLYDVSEEMEKWNASWGEENDAAMPYFINMLTKDLYFQPKQ